MKASVIDAKIIELPKFLDARGNLSFAENNVQIPFEINVATPAPTTPSLKV